MTTPEVPRWRCDQCQTEVRVPMGMHSTPAHCVSCGGAMRELAPEDARTGREGLAVDHRDLYTRFTRTMEAGALLSDLGGRLCEDDVDHAVMTAGIFLFACHGANVNPQQFLDAICEFVVVRVPPEKPPAA